MIARATIVHHVYADRGDLLPLCGLVRGPRDPGLGEAQRWHTRSRPDDAPSALRHRLRLLHGVSGVRGRRVQIENDAPRPRVLTVGLTDTEVDIFGSLADEYLQWSTHQTTMRCDGTDAYETGPHGWGT